MYTKNQGKTAAGATDSRRKTEQAMPAAEDSTLLAGPVEDSAAVTDSASDAITVPFVPVTDQDVAQASRALAASGLDWSQQVAAARRAWTRLDDNKLLGSEGDAIKLAALVEQHYSVTGAEAQRQVAAFLAQQAPG